MHDVATNVGVSVVYVSKVERGEKAAPVGEKLLRWLSAIDLEEAYPYAQELALDSMNSVTVSLKTKKELARHAFLALARDLDDLPDCALEDIMEIIKRKGK